MPGDWSVTYDEALGLYRRGQYAGALAALREAEKPGVPKLVYLEMRCHIKLDMLSEALACCEVLDTTFHDPRVAVLFQQFRDKGVTADQEILRELTLLCAYEQASRLFRQHEYAEALEVLDEVGGQSNAELVYARARCLSKLGRFDEALESCRELEEQYGDPRAEELIRKIEKSHGVRKQVLPPLEIPTQDFESALPQAAEETFAEPQANQQEMDYWDAVQREAKHEALITSLQDQVTTLSGEIVQLRAGESDAANALEDARAECNRLKDALNERESALTEAEQRKAGYDAALGVLQERAEAAAAERDALHTKHKEAEQALITANEDRDRVRRMLEERDTAGSDASLREAEQESLIASLRAQVEILDGEAKRLHAAEQEQAQALGEAHAECARLKESVADTESNAAQEKTRFEAQVAALEEQLRKTLADSEQSRIREGDWAAKVEGIRAERDTLKKELEELQRTSAESAQQIETLGAQIALLEGQLKSKASEIDEARAGGQSSATELGQVRLACELLQNEVAERDAAVDRAAQREAELEAAIAALRVQAEAAAVSAEQSRTQEASTASELAEVRAARDKLEEDLMGYEHVAEEALRSDSMNKALIASLQEQLKAAGDDGSASRVNADRIAAELEGLRSERDHLKQTLDEHADAVAQSSQREEKLQTFAAFLKAQFDAAKAEIEQGVVEASRKNEELEAVCADRGRLKEALDGRDAAAAQAAEREAKLEALVLSLQQHVEKLSAKVHELEAAQHAPARQGEGESAEEGVSVQPEPDSELQELALETEALMTEAAAVEADAAARATPPPPVKTEEERRQERKESQDKLRAEQLRFLFPMLRPGIRVREVLNMYGQPSRIEEADAASRAVQEPRTGGILGRMFKESSGRPEMWIYDSPPWGSVRLEIVDKVLLRIHWEI